MKLNSLLKFYQKSEPIIYESILYAITNIEKEKVDLEKLDIKLLLENKDKAYIEHLITLLVIKFETELKLTECNKLRAELNKLIYLLNMYQRKLLEV